ncbi:MAG: arginase family protein [Sphaerobacter sp.]|nr:arginase family protein [Sphaerobacter sp.]
MATEHARATGRAAPNRLRTAPIQPIRVPLALGAVRAGVERGAAVLDDGLRARAARRLPHLHERLLPSVTVPMPTGDAPLDGRACPGQAMYLDAIAAASPALAETVRTALSTGALALTLGGDHALAIGTLAAAAAAATRLAVIWIDAHGDLNTPETSPSGHVHGMSLAIALGRGPAVATRLFTGRSAIRPEDVSLLGIRDLDPSERSWLAEGTIHYATMATIDARGLDATVAGLIRRIAASGADAVHVSFDLDVLDPLLLPGTGTRAHGGFTFREAARLLRLLRESDLPICSLDWVELNPALDPSGASTSVAIELLAIALGEEPV